MAFVHADPTALSAAKYETDNLKREKLDAFRSKVQKAKHVKFWRSSEDLAGKVALSYSLFVQQYPASGWVRADGLASAEALEEVVKLRKKVAELEFSLNAVSVNAPPEAASIASGSDKFAMEARIKGTVTLSGGYSGKAVIHWFERPVTWDQIFNALAPRLLSEGSESELKGALGALIANAHLDENLESDFMERVHAINKNVSFSEVRHLTIEVEEEAFGTVLVQLLALGLIQKGSQKRGVNDENKYWTVTPWGEKYALRLRAIPKVLDSKSVTI